MPGPRNARRAMATSTPVLLLVADISGYTRFMQMHPVATSHARQITIRLLRALIRAAHPPLRLAEIEGDAVFFYAPVSPDTSDDVAAQVKAQIPQLFRAFKHEIAVLEQMDGCACEACSNVGSLQLKQVAHSGEATIEHIEHFEKLFSLDIILVHRLLKNSVEAHEYLLLTDSAYEMVGRFYDLIPEIRKEDLEGLGAIDTFVFRGPPFEALIPSLPADPVRPSRFGRLLWRLQLGIPPFLHRVLKRQVRLLPDRSSEQ